MVQVWVEREFQSHVNGREPIKVMVSERRGERESRRQRRLPKRRSRYYNFANTSGSRKRAQIKNGLLFARPYYRPDNNWHRHRRSQWRQEMPSFRLFAQVFAAIDAALARA